MVKGRPTFVSIPKIRLYASVHSSLISTPICLPTSFDDMNFNCFFSIKRDISAQPTVLLRIKVVISGTTSISI